MNSIPRITDPTWIFTVVLTLILFVPLVFRWLRIPPIIGLIVAGVLVGPHAFNVLAYDSSFELFGQVGIYYIMFLAGLELEMGSVEKYGRDGFRFGFLTFSIPFVLGLAASVWVLHYSLATSLLMACIFASHTLVTYPTVGRYGLGRHRVVVVSVVATAFALFAALLVLAVVVGGRTPGMTWLSWVFFALRCGLYVGFVVFFFPRLCRWFFRLFQDGVLQFLFVLGLVFLSASMAKLVGLEGLLGAFLGGLTVNRLIPKTSPLMSRIEFVGNALFIPYFLLGVGMIIDVGILARHPETIWLVLLMVVVGTLTKFLASAMMAWTMGEEKSSMWLMFGLTNAHAAGALAIVTIGTAPDVMLMNDQVLGGTVMLILFSCIISGFATSRGAKQLALSDTTLEDNRGSYHGRCLITYSQEDNVDVMTQLAILIRNPFIPDGLMGLCISLDNGQEMKVINGDKPLLFVPEKGDIWVYPSPWNGKEGFGNPLKAPLGGIICLEQGGLNQFHQLDAGEAVTPLLGQFISMMRTEEQIRKICRMEEQMIQRVPVYRMVNRGDECSAAQLHDFLQSELENMR